MGMRKEWLGGLLVVALSGAGPAQAQLRASIGIEAFSWKEDTVPRVKETGSLLAAGLDYTRPADVGLLWAYRGRLYGGAVSYEGSTLFPPVQPVTGTTEYAGTVQEGQLRYRFDAGGQRRLDVVVGAGFDIWQRKLNARQTEDYVVGFARLGIETERDGRGWIAGGGVKIPFYTWEDAHLTSVGFDRNPVLKPGGQVSGYLHAGYRPDGPIAVIFYVDGLRFSRSPSEPVVHATNGATSVFQPASTRVSAGVKVQFEFQ